MEMVKYIGEKIHLNSKSLRRKRVESITLSRAGSRTASARDVNDGLRGGDEGGGTMFEYQLELEAPKKKKCC